MPLGAGVHPARPDRGIHRPLFDAQNGVGQKNRGGVIALRRVPNRKPGRGPQPVEIFVGLVVRLVAPAAADEIADIAEILTDDEELRAAVAEPLFPMADDAGGEVEFGAAPDPARTALDTDAARLARRDELVKFRHFRPMPGPARRAGAAGGRQGRAARGAATYSRNKS